MNCGALIVLCVVILSQELDAEVEYNLQGCPVDISIPHFIKHSSNCSQFLQCSNGLTITHDCPAGLLFNSKENICDWPDNVNCTEVPISDVYYQKIYFVYVNRPVKKSDINKNESAYNKDGCPFDFSKLHYFSHNNCTQFYQCANGIPFLHNCPSGLLFNSELNVCDWPINVNCSNSGTIDDHLLPTTNNTNNDSSTNETSYNELGCPLNYAMKHYISHNNTCNQYYECFDSIPILKNCTEDFLFNIVNNTCDWPENVDCGDRYNPNNTTFKGNETVSGNNTINNNAKNTNETTYNEFGCPLNYSLEHYIPHTNCYQYYECIIGVPILRTCPTNTYYEIPLLFNIINNTCDWPENVNCGGRYNPNTFIGNETVIGNNTVNNNATNTNETTYNEFGCSLNYTVDHFIPHTNCNQYYKCAHGIQILENCTNGLLFSIIDKTCDLLEHVDCGQRYNPYNNSSREIENPVVNNTVSSNETIVKQNQSVNPSSNSGNQSLNYNNQTYDELKQPTCPIDPSVIHYIPHKKCDQFYKCSNGFPTLNYCLNGHMFNLKTNVCDWSGNVHCSGRIVTENLDETNLGFSESKQPTCPIDPFEQHFIAHSNCNKYYKCVYGIPVVMSCLSGLFYNVKTNACVSSNDSCLHSVPTYTAPN